MAAIAPISKTDDPRERLILEHYPLVRTIACRMVRRFPSSVDVDELINVGAMGLIDAVDRFDTSRNVPFKAYAEIRIRGAIVDALRKSDWVPRSVRRKFSRIESTRTQLLRTTGANPNREQMAKALEMSVDEYEDLVGDSHIRKLVSLDSPADAENPTPLSERIAGENEDPTETWAAAELREKVIESVHLLPAKERSAVSLYYLHGLTLKEIGEILGVTESRACQLRGQGIKRLKFRLRGAVH